MKDKLIGLGIIYLGLVGLLCPSALLSEMNSPQFKLTSYLGSNLGTESASSSLTLEPVFRFPTGQTTEIEVSSSIDRPFDAYQNFSVPKSDLFLKQILLRSDNRALSLRYGLSFPDIDRWKLEGYQIRPNLNLQMTVPLSSRVTLSGRAGTFLFFTAYTQHPNGDNYPRFGFTEKLSLNYHIGIFLAEANLNIEQANTGIWKNDYSFQEIVSFEVQKNLSLGLMHELLAESIDSTTGFYRPIRVFDGRDSRISGFIEMKI